MASSDDAPRAPTDIASVAANVPFVVRTFVGFAVLTVLLNVIGVLVIAGLLAAINATATASQITALLTAAVVLTVVSTGIGVGLGALTQRRTLRWLLRGETPGPDDARQALRLPFDLATITVTLWGFSSLVIGIVAGAVGEPVRVVLGIVGGILLSGLVSGGFIYLVVGRVNRKIVRLALAAHPPREAPVFGVRRRLLINWLLTTALPLVGLALVLAAPADRAHIIGVAVVVVGIALLVGGVSTALIARAIGTPLREVVEALRQVGDGRLDVAVTLDDAGEIGLVQNGVNEMVAGLQERDRVTDLFGRHVGPAVAAEAINSGVTLSGEFREVVALFVDITGSTKLTQVTEPTEFVDMLNRFFEIVVEEVEAHGGLVNKFEGDAALCVFGAPAPLPDAPSAGLRAARGIRDRIAEGGELEIGIGVAYGQVIAGQIGTASRLEYTVIGDAVNEASRLTELAKRVDGRILSSENTVTAAAEQEQAEWQRGRSLRLRGREELTHSYRTVRVPEASASLSRRLHDVARAVVDLPTRASAGEHDQGVSGTDG